MDGPSQPLKPQEALLPLMTRVPMFEQVRKNQAHSEKGKRRQGRRIEKKQTEEKRERI